jgi:hypothetical protein
LLVEQSRYRRSRVFARRLASRFAITPLFVFAAWLVVTGALGPSA